MISVPGFILNSRAIVRLTALEVRTNMIGVKGVPFTSSFHWVKWSRSAKELKAMGADEIISDKEAQRRGYVVRAAKSAAKSK